MSFDNKLVHYDHEGPEAVYFVPDESTDPDIVMDWLFGKFGIPPALGKAVVDPFDYAVGLKNGDVLFFHEAYFNFQNPEWIRLDGVGERYESPLEQVWTRANTTGKAMFHRGVWVRLSDISWAADAPFGS